MGSPPNPPRAPVLLLNLWWWFLSLAFVLPTLYWAGPAFQRGEYSFALVATIPYVFGVAYLLVLLLNFHSAWFWAISLAFNLFLLISNETGGFAFGIPGAVVSLIYLSHRIRERNSALAMKKINERDGKSESHLDSGDAN